MAVWWRANMWLRVAGAARETSVEEGPATRLLKKLLLSILYMRFEDSPKPITTAEQSRLCS